MKKITQKHLRKRLALAEQKIRLYHKLAEAAGQILIKAKARIEEFDREMKDPK